MFVWYLTIGAVLMFSLLVFFPNHNQQSYGHLDHSPRYNGGGSSIGEYYIFQAMDPEYAKPKEPVDIHFSIQDRDGRDVKNVTSMVEIYSQKTGERLQVYPWTARDTGDFNLEFVF